MNALAFSLDRLQVIYFHPPSPPQAGVPDVRGFFVCGTAHGRDHVVSRPFATEALAVAELVRLGGQP